MLIAFAILVLMYYGMIFSIGEMAAAMPHTGGAYSFARSAMGPWGGLVTGAAETIEYVATTAVIVYFSAPPTRTRSRRELLGVSMPAWVWWIILYAAFIALNAAGAAISFKFAIVVSIISIGIILVFSVMALVSGAFNWDSLWNIAPDPGQTEFLPHGVLPILFALPFAMWFFLGIEELPLAAEESTDPVRDIPRAGFWARGTLIVTGLLVLFLNTGVLGAEATGVAAEPLLDGFRAIVGRPARRGARAVRPHRPARLAAGHHVRLRPQHVLAVTGRVLPEVPLAHRQAQDAVGRAARRRRHRLHRPRHPRRARHRSRAWERSPARSC